MFAARPRECSSRLGVRHFSFRRQRCSALVYSAWTACAGRMASKSLWRVIRDPIYWLEQPSHLRSFAWRLICTGPALLVRSSHMTRRGECRNSVPKDGSLIFFRRGGVTGSLEMEESIRCRRDLLGFCSHFFGLCCAVSPLDFHSSTACPV